LPEVGTGLGGITISNVSYYDSNTPPVLTVVDPENYLYDVTGNRVVVTGIPTQVSSILTNPIQVTWVVNTSYYAQYPNIKQAGLLLLTHLYNNRSNTTIENLKDLPFGVAQLLRPYKPLVM